MRALHRLAGPDEIALDATPVRPVFERPRSEFGAAITGDSPPKARTRDDSLVDMELELFEQVGVDPTWTTAETVIAPASSGWWSQLPELDIAFDPGRPLS